MALNGTRVNMEYVDTVGERKLEDCKQAEESLNHILAKTEREPTTNMFKHPFYHNICLSPYKQSL